MLATAAGCRSRCSTTRPTRRRSPARASGTCASVKKDNHQGTKNTKKTRRSPMARHSVFAFLCALCTFVVNPSYAAEPPLEAGFGEADITPALGGKPVFIAGFGQNRKATAVLDPLAVRAVVLRHGDRKIAIACADVVGLFRPSVERVRKELPGFSYVLVSSTHNHHGPDTLGLWGPGPFTSGVDRDYLRSVEAAIVRAIRDAEKALRPAAANI